VSYVASIQRVQNDLKDDLYLQCQKADGTGADISGYSEVRLKVWKLGSTTPKINNASHVTVDTEASGKLHYTVQAGDFDTVETYQVEVQVTFTGGKILSFQGMQIEVVAEAPGVDT
jgi:Tol biopolymer transport system component